MFDLDAYLARIGLSGRPGLAEIHRAHATTIPFENLDPHRGCGVSLEVSDLQRKLVAERRGGYCFEHNLLLKAALEELGAEVEMMLARVRFGAPGVVRPRAHLVLRVCTDEGEWHADVGFGTAGLLDPLPFGPGAEVEQSGWRYRVVQEDPELVLQMVVDGEWADVYAFPTQPVPAVDIEVSNWFTSAHPRSPFVAGLIAATVAPDGTRTRLSDWDGLKLVVETPHERSVTELTPAAVPELLATRFGLPGFALGADERLVAAAR